MIKYIQIEIDGTEYDVEIELAYSIEQSGFQFEYGMEKGFKAETEITIDEPSIIATIRKQDNVLVEDPKLNKRAKPIVERWVEANKDELETVILAKYGER